MGNEERTQIVEGTGQIADQATIERLRASKAELDAESSEAGRRAGAEWARSCATAKQLKRLENARGDENWSFGVGTSAYSDAANFVFIVDGRDCVRSDTEQFWEREVGNDWEQECDTEFVQAFAEAAMEVWEAVESQL